MKKTAVIVLFIFANVAGASALRTKEYARVFSPDGAFSAVAKNRAYAAWLPASIGGSGDKADWVRILTKDGREIGRVPVAMVSEIQDIRWSRDEASIVGVASWQLTGQ